MSIAFRLLSQNHVEGGDPFYQVVHGYEEMLTNGETVAVYNLLTRVVHEAGDNFPWVNPRLCRGTIKV